MTDTVTKPIELTWESKDIEVGRIRSALAEQWHRWEARISRPQHRRSRLHRAGLHARLDRERHRRGRQQGRRQTRRGKPLAAFRLLPLPFAHPGSQRPLAPTRATYSVRVKVEERVHTRGVAPVRLETITILAPPGNDQSLASLSSPLLIPDLPDVLYVPFGPIAGNLLVASLFELVDVLVVDTVWTQNAGRILRGAGRQLQSPGVSDINDIAWSRLLVWRQLVAQFFDQPDLARIARHDRGSSNCLRAHLG